MHDWNAIPKGERGERCMACGGKGHRKDACPTLGGQAQAKRDDGASSAKAARSDANAKGPPLLVQVGLPNHPPQTLEVDQRFLQSKHS